MTLEDDGQDKTRQSAVSKKLLSAFNSYQIGADEQLEPNNKMQTAYVKSQEADNNLAAKKKSE